MGNKIVQKSNNAQFSSLSDFHSVTKDSVVFYAQRRNIMKACGEDTYPLVAKLIDKNGKSFDLILADDGLGSASAKHPSLIRFFETNKVFSEREKPHYTDEEVANAMAYLLRVVFEDILNDEYKEVMNYAERCLANAPVNSMFSYALEGSDPSISEYEEMYEPFFLKTSSFIGSRITTIGLFYYLTKFFKENEVVLNEKTAEEIKTHIDQWIIDIKTALTQTAFCDDKPIIDCEYDVKHGEVATCKRNCMKNTFAFYIVQEEKEKLVVASYNIGDARCYKLDKADGIFQISDDDAFPNGDMCGVVSFGEIINTNNQTKHKFFELKKPCALFTCTDGVYDTFLNSDKSNVDSGINFERNLYKRLRACYSLDDVYLQVGKGFYFHTPEKDCLSQESPDIRAPQGVKPDDSGTFAMKTYWTEDTDSFSQLWEDDNNTLSLVLKGMENDLIRDFCPPQPLTTDEKICQAHSDLLDTMVSNVFNMKEFKDDLSKVIRDIFIKMRSAEKKPILLGLDESKNNMLLAYMKSESDTDCLNTVNYLLRSRKSFLERAWYLGLDKDFDLDALIENGEVPYFKLKNNKMFEEICEEQISKLREAETAPTDVAKTLDEQKRELFEIVQNENVKREKPYYAGRRLNAFIRLNDYSETDKAKYDELLPDINRCIKSYGLPDFEKSE